MLWWQSRILIRRHGCLTGCLRCAASRYRCGSQTRKNHSSRSHAARVRRLPSVATFTRTGWLGKQGKREFVQVLRLMEVFRIDIGALYAERDHDGPFGVRGIGARHVGEKDEAQLIGDFVANLPRDDAVKGPILASFNGGSFDLPVLRYRALAHGIAMPGLFRGGSRDYWYRFGWDHIDLCDTLSGFGASSRPSLNEMAALLGVPSKLEGMEGSQVEAFAQAGRLDEVASYCLGNVITTFRLLLRFALVRGELNARALGESEESLDLAVERLAKQRPMLRAMLRNP